MQAAFPDRGAAATVPETESTSSRASATCHLLRPAFAGIRAATTVFSNHAPPTPIVDDIGKIAPRPVFLIYADPGMGGEVQRQPRYFAAAGEPESMWKVPGASHTGGIEAQPRVYERRLIGFLDGALLER